MLFWACVLLNCIIMNKVVRGGVREIIYKVFMRCMAEYQAGNLFSKPNDVYKRTVDFTSVSESTVRRIAKHGMEKDWKFSTPGKHRKGRPAKVLDDFDTCAINLGAGTSQELSSFMDGVEYLDFDLLE